MKKTFCFCYEREVDEETHERSAVRLISQYKTSRIESDQLLDTLQVMIRLYTSDDKSQSAALLKRCRLNPNYETIQRNDLNYYTPQLINYLVFHEDMSHKQLLKFLRKASQSDFFFAHSVYFQLKSVSQIVRPKETIDLKAVQSFLQVFTEEMSTIYADQYLIATKLIEEFIERDRIASNIDPQNTIRVIKKLQEATQSVYKAQHKSETLNRSNVQEIKEYGTTFYDPQSQISVTARQIGIKNYSAIFKGDQPQEANDGAQQDRGFLSTIDFLNDLIVISDRLRLANPKIISLRADLQRVNMRLPAAVYIPFVKHQIRHYMVLNIVISESRVFSTKERSPFSLCLELFRPEEENELKNSRFEMALSNPKTTKSYKNHLNRLSNSGKDYPEDRISKSLLDSDIMSQQVGELKQRSGMSFSYSARNFNEQIQQDYAGLEREQEPHEEALAGISAFYGQDHQNIEISASVNRPENLSGSLEFMPGGRRDVVLTSQEIKELDQSIFGESSESQNERIKSESPFKNLKSHKLLNIIIKTDDNLKQEQFALQLISQFEQIFKEEGLPLRLNYYEVLSLGPACGIIEMVKVYKHVNIKDATTIDSLKKHLFQKRRELSNFSTFFRAFFRNRYDIALQNYLNSLVAYCLVTYFLQVKDRHNGNILLHRDGSLIHIDFGFFLSNAPGKGIEFERSVPFKLLSEHIDVLGGISSSTFDQFRKLFFRGFQACMKNQNKILILVKMMYSGHGTTLPCFKRGDQAIIDLEARFNPLRPGESDAELNVFTQFLINSSLDNWRARWYDKFQYYFQGIFY